MRLMITSKNRRAVAAICGNRCAFPGCNQKLMIDDTTFIGELASIEAFSEGGPRYNPETKRRELSSPENFLLLCPNHHKMVDRMAEQYTTQWLREARAAHLERIKAAIQKGTSQPEVKLSPNVEISLKEAAKLWESSKENSSEEYWQQLFQQCPMVLAQLFPQSMIQIGRKSYVGGKSLDNSGGNLVDFVYANTKTNNVVLVEIKTPKTKLLGKLYRQNAYAISEELTGSIVQVLNYKESLLKEYYSLSKGATPFSAFSPKCIVIAGSVENEMDTPIKMKSYEHFRNDCSRVEIVSYDELFDKVQSVIDMTGSAEHRIKADAENRGGAARDGHWRRGLCGALDEC
jgi:hypothetical protein